jgi:uncharacterized protein YqgV (UPF0045/DUF77 family)
MLAEIHVSPSPAGTPDDRYAHVEAAIAVVESSGLHYEVGALGTTFEGDADAVWAALRAAHEAVLTSGAESVITSIRLGERAGEGYSMDRLTAKFRR